MSSASEASSRTYHQPGHKALSERFKRERDPTARFDPIQPRAKLHQNRTVGDESDKDASNASSAI